MNFSPVQSMDTDHIIPQADEAQMCALLVFYLQERAYGLAIEHVVQIIPMLKLTPVPQMEQIIEGVANVHGRVVPVLSARRQLGLQQLPPRLYTPIILVSTGDRTVGLIVDEVSDVIHLPAGQIAHPDTILPGGRESAPVLDGVVYREGKAILVLNPRFLLRPGQVRALQSVPDFIPEPPAPPVESEFNLPLRAESAPQIAGAAAGSEPEPVQAKPSPAAGARSKSRRRKNIAATLTSEVASLAADLPPVEGGDGTAPADSAAGASAPAASAAAASAPAASAAAASATAASAAAASESPDAGEQPSAGPQS